MSRNKGLLFLWQRCVDRMAGIGDWIAWVVLNFLAVDVQLQECNQRKADSQIAGDRASEAKVNLNNCADKDGIQRYCESILSESKDRHSHIAEKVKVLLTIGTFFCGLIIGLLSYAHGMGTPPWVFLLPAPFALMSFFLLLFYYGMGQYQTLILSQEDIQVEPDVLKIRWAQSMLLVAEDLDRVGDFLANVYIGARRSLIIAWVILLLGLVICGVCRKPKVLSETRHYQEMIEVLDRQIEVVENQLKVVDGLKVILNQQIRTVGEEEQSLLLENERGPYLAQMNAPESGSLESCRKETDVGRNGLDREHVPTEHMKVGGPDVARDRGNR